MNDHIHQFFGLCNVGLDDHDRSRSIGKRSTPRSIILVCAPIDRRLIVNQLRSTIINRNNKMVMMTCFPVYQDRDMFDKADQEVNEWRALEITNDTAQRKVCNGIFNPLHRAHPVFL